MTKLQSSASPAKSQAKWWIYLACGALIPIGIGGYLLKKQAEATPIERQAAEYMGVPPAAWHKIGIICDKAEFKHTISEDDWNVLRDAFKDEKQRFLVIGPLSYLTPGFKHKKEAVEMLKQYILERHKDGDLVAVAGLYKFEDPIWRAEATRLMNSNDPQISEPTQRLFKIYLKK